MLPISMAWQPILTTWYQQYEQKYKGDYWYSPLPSNRCNRKKYSPDKIVMIPKMIKLYENAVCVCASEARAGVSKCSSIAPKPIPKLIANCWLTDNKLLPLLVWLERSRAILMVFIVLNCSELHAPIKVKNGTLSQIGVVWLSCDSSMILTPINKVLPANVLR